MSFLLSNWQYVVIAILTATCAFLAEQWRSTHDELVGYQSTIRAYAEAKEEETTRINKQQEDNLERIKQYEADLPKVRADAIAAYRAAHSVPRSDSSGGQMPGITASKSVYDGTVQERVVIDDETIGNCGDDANKLREWQEFAKLNHLPVKD